MILTKVCLFCSKSFDNVRKDGKHLSRNQFAKSLCCSLDCANKYRREFDISQYSSPEDYRKYHALLRKKNSEKLRKYHREYMRVYRNVNRDEKLVKQKARRKVTTEISAGRLNKESCKVCGEVKVQAHHEDYTKPLEIVWLCTVHHKQIHHKNHE